MPSKKPEIGAETRKRIKDGLRNWDKVDSEARRRFEDTKHKLDQQHQHLTATIISSEQLTEKYLAIRINTLAT
jgi:hypothetical protein